MKCSSQRTMSKVNSHTAFHLWLNGCCDAKRFFKIFNLLRARAPILAEKNSKTINGNHGTNEKWLRFSAWDKKFFGQNSLIKRRENNTTRRRVSSLPSRHATKRWSRNNFDASKSLWKHKLCACMLTSEDFVILSCLTSIYEVASSALLSLHF